MNGRKLLIVLGALGVLIMTILLINKFLTKTTSVNDNSLDWLKNRKIAHRGLHDNKNVVENSISAIQLTIQEKENIEIDVQKTKDNIVVVYHDENLLRLTGLDKKVSELNYNELKELKLLNTEEYIPTLKEVLEVVAGQVGLLIEIKNEELVGELENLVYEELKDYEGEFAIQAFNPFVLEWFKLNANEIKRGQLAGGYEESNLKFYEKFLLSNLLLNFKSKPSFIAYNVDELPKSIVNRLRSNGTLVLAWTVTSETDENIVKENCDNIIYERY